MSDPILKITDLESSNSPNNNIVSVNMFTQGLSLNNSTITQTFVLRGGWNLVGIYIDAQKSNTAGQGTFANGNTLQHLLAEHSSNVVIAKNYLGQAYIPEFNFDAIGAMINGYGYQIKMSGSFSDTYTFNLSGIPIITSNSNSVLGTFERYGMTELNFPQGWSFFTIPYDIGDSSTGSFDVAAVMGYILEGYLQSGGNNSSINDFIIIIKDNLGAAYVPQFFYNGIGDFKKGQAYAIKTTQALTLNFSGNVI